MDEELEREFCQHAASDMPNYHSDYSRKTAQIRLSESNIKVPNDRKGNYKPKIIRKYGCSAESMEG